MSQAPSLDEVIQHIGNLPSLPVVVMELLSSLAQEEVNVRALADKISQDQALTAKTLRLANSSFYGMQRQITTLEQAIAVLGFHTVRSLATTAALMQGMQPVPGGRFSHIGFWRHAIGTAVCSRELAAILGAHTDMAYTAGLLHDIGRLVLVTQFSAAYEGVLSRRHDQDCSLMQAERDVLSMDHAQVGQALALHWKFPQALKKAIEGHHSPKAEPAGALSRIVLLGDAMAHALDLSHDVDDTVPALPASIWEELPLSDSDLLSVMENAVKQFVRTSQALGV